MSDFSHLNKKNRPRMVNVGAKKNTRRKARARALMFLGEEVLKHFNNEELHSKKGPVFQTAILAGIQGVKKTADLIPMCHPLQVNGVNLEIELADKDHVELFCTVEVEGKTGVEMEALTGVSVACLTLYDMCKSISQDMRILEIGLLEKTGGKADFKRVK